MRAMEQRASAIVERTLESLPSTSGGSPPAAAAAIISRSASASGNASSPSRLTFWAHEETALRHNAREFDRHLSRLFATVRSIAAQRAHVVDRTSNLEALGANLSDLSVDLLNDYKSLRSALTVLYDSFANYSLRRYVVALLPDTSEY